MWQTQAEEAQAEEAQTGETWSEKLDELTLGELESLSRTGLSGLLALLGA